MRCVVAAGGGKPLWIYDPPETAIHVPSVPEVGDPDPDLAFMLDPSEELFSSSLRVEATVNKTGRRVVVAGREAAAATVLMMPVSGKPSPREITLNRPFIFAIAERETGEILFLGRVMNPQK